MIAVIPRIKRGQAPLKRAPVQLCPDPGRRLAGLLRTKGEH
jgi:hypothetical protein